MIESNATTRDRVRSDCLIIIINLVRECDHPLMGSNRRFGVKPCIYREKNLYEKTFTQHLGRVENPFVKIPDFGYIIGEIRIRHYR